MDRRFASRPLPELLCGAFSRSLIHYAKDRIFVLRNNRNLLRFCSVWIIFGRKALAPMDTQQLRALITRRPFRPFQIATSAGDHYAILEEADIFNNRRRPDLYVIFTDDGLAHWIESGDIVSVTSL